MTGTIELEATGQARVDQPKRPPLSETPYDPELDDEWSYSHKFAMETALERAAYRGKQQVRRELIDVGWINVIGGWTDKWKLRWIIQDVR